MMECIENYIRAGAIKTNQHLQIEEIAVGFAILRHIFWSDNKRYAPVLFLMYYPLPIIMLVGMSGHLYKLIRKF